jgi:hypothetical protein
MTGMNNFLHSPVTIDSFFKERLGKLPVDAGDSDLQWQSIKQQVKKAPPRLPGANALTICLIIGVTALLLWGISYKKNISPAAPENSSSQLPVKDNSGETSIDKMENRSAAASPLQHHDRVSVGNKADSANGQLLLPSPVLSANEQKPDSAKRIIIATRPDSSKRLFAPESKKDSLFIFW